MKFIILIITQIAAMSSAQAQTENSHYLLTESGKHMAYVNVVNSKDPSKVCYRFPNSNWASSFKPCDGYTQLYKLHRVLPHEALKESIAKLNLTPNVLWTKSLNGERVSVALKVYFITADGYVGFSPGPEYSWNSDSRFFDTTISPNSILVASPKDLKEMELVREITNHISIGESWREDQYMFTVLTVYENGLAQIGESSCKEQSDQNCTTGYHTYSLRKLAN